MRFVSVPGCLLAVVAMSFVPIASGDADPAHPDIVLFFQAASSDETIAREALKEIGRNWRDGYTPMFIDLTRLMRAPRRVTQTPIGAVPFRDPDSNTLLGFEGDERVSVTGSPVRRRLIRFLKKQTGRNFGDDLDRWRRWMWSLPYDPHPEYAFFKAGIYRNIDPRMTEFLYPDRPAEIRLDEIDWGGVRVNGVPPLDRPPTISPGSADWLADGDVVFGIEINGKPRAYPKRIVGWHEIVRDTVGGVDIALVFCSMCNSVIPYESRLGDEELTLGTSGLLYRSNKLMFDEETMTLWSSLYGKPVVGPRVGSGGRLRRFPVVTTTWGEWREMHPDTTVLSRDTGFEKDYTEGAAYRDYESTDRLWFEVPAIDRRLKNKAEVVTLERDGVALAVSRKFLLDHRIYYHTVAGERVAFLTSPAGTTRVYAVGETSFSAWGQGRTLLGPDGAPWRVDEDALVAENGVRLPRVATSPAYWFGWYAQYPDTELVK